jgi:4-oxalocrotonate tautomerase
MPTLSLKVTPVPSEDVQRSLASALTAITAETLGKSAEVTAVMLEPMPSARWWIGARAPELPTALLEISITAGTNTAEQKAHFIEAAHATLQRHLAPGGMLEEASYIVVREWPATDWGYAGRTQQSRRTA